MFLLVVFDIKKNISWKLELNCFKNEGGDRFLVNYLKFQRKLPLKIFNSIQLFLNLKKNCYMSKVNWFFLFCKNYILVYTQSFEIRANVIFCKKNVGIPPMPLTNTFEVVSHYFSVLLYYHPVKVCTKHMNK